MSNDTWDWVRAHPLLAGALGCTLVSTAHAEYTLATSTDVNEWVALAVPGALDLYVIQALRVRRDVATAVLVMVAANVVSHLLVAGLYPRDIWWQVGVVSAVGALAPVLLWRVHSLERTRTRKELLWGAQAGAGSAPAECAPVDASPDANPQVSPYSEPSAPAPAAPEWGPRMVWGALTAPDPEAVTCVAHSLEECDECADKYGAPDRIPEWMNDEYPPSAPHSKTGAVPYLAPVPDLPAEYEASAVHSESPLKASDWDYLPGAQRYVDDRDKPSVRGLKIELGIGQERAERLLTHLGVIL